MRVRLIPWRAAFLADDVLAIPGFLSDLSLEGWIGPRGWVAIVQTHAPPKGYPRAAYLGLVYRPHAQRSTTVISGACKTGKGSSVALRIGWLRQARRTNLR